MTDASRLDELVADYQADATKMVTVHRYEDSGHCRLDKDHAEEYAAAIDKALEAVLGVR